jgi:hypothetical protein
LAQHNSQRLATVMVQINCTNTSFLWKWHMAA